MFKYKTLLIFLIYCFLISCSTTKNNLYKENIFTLKDSYCKAPFSYPYNRNTLPSFNADSIIFSNQGFQLYLSDQSILIVNALKLTKEINRLIELRNSRIAEDRLERLEIHHKIQHKLNMAQSELEAVAAEFDCEGERVEQMAIYINKLNENKTNKLVTWSIIAASAASIGTGIFVKGSTPNVIDISAGVIGAGLGFATLNPKGKEIEFIHNRNLLRDIWTGTLESENFPPFVWYMYNEKLFSNRADGLSNLDFIKQRWLQFHFDGDLQKANESILFDNGGQYHSQDLFIRASMLNQMQAITRIINHNITYLLIDLENIYEDL